MDPLDDLAMALAIGLPIVLVSAGCILVTLMGDGPDSPRREAGPATAPPGDEAAEGAATGPNR